MPAKKRPSVVLHNGKLEEVDNDRDIDVEFTSPDRFTALNANLIPSKENVQSTRIPYGARFFGQSLSLVNREAPWVQNAINDEDDASWDEFAGKQLGAVFAGDDDEEATVEAITPDSIALKHKDGSVKQLDLWHNAPYNRKSYLSNEPTVKQGDVVHAGQPLAASNFTDKNGVAAMGVNARTALVSDKGFSMDDAIIISESFAKRIASEHMYNNEVEKNENTRFGLDHFRSLFPDVYTKDQVANLDENGVVRVGATLHKGDPIVLATTPKTISSSSAQLGRLGRAMRTARNNASQTWEHDYPGEVTDAINTKDRVKVFTKAYSPAVYGDKICLRPGAKGIISKIIPDDQILRSADGKPFEVLLNSLSLPSRVNAATIYEMGISKAAEKDGKPIKMKYTPPGVSTRDIVRDMLSKRGLSPTERVYDPLKGRWLDQEVTTGTPYYLKLMHVAESKNSSRGTGAYSVDQAPMKGGSEAAQAKRLSGLEATSLMSAGAYNVLRESSTLKGQQNDEYWRLIRQGYKPAPPGSPFVWDKFRTLLTGAGYRVKDLGKGVLRLGMMTDKDLEAKRPVEVKSGALVKMDTLEPIEGGLFDKSLMGGKQWGKITLDEPLPNPAAESTIQTLLGLTNTEMRSVLSGQKEL
ncbi:MAG: hypothetical protein RR382_00525 [Tannerellaceae bacterium]